MVVEWPFKKTELNRFTLRYSHSRMLTFEMCFKVMYQSQWAVHCKNMTEQCEMCFKVMCQSQWAVGSKNMTEQCEMCFKVMYQSQWAVDCKNMTEQCEMKCVLKSCLSHNGLWAVRI